MAAKRKAVAAPLDAALIADLRAVERKFADASNAIDEMHMDERFKNVPASNVVEFSWLMQGFTEDLLTDVRNMAGLALALRANVMGGLSGEEVRLLRAAGGESSEEPFPSLTPIERGRS